MLVEFLHHAGRGTFDCTVPPQAGDFLLLKIGDTVRDCKVAERRLYRFKGEDAVQLFLIDDKPTPERNREIARMEPFGIGEGDAFQASWVPPAVAAGGPPPDWKAKD